MLLEITSIFAGKVAFVTYVAGTYIQTWKMFQDETSHFWIYVTENFKNPKFQNQAIRGFWAKTLFLTYRGEKTTLEWLKLVSETISSIIGIYLCWKVFLVFRFGHQKCQILKFLNTASRPMWPVFGNYFLGRFLLRLSRTKRSQVMSMRKFGPAALNFG